MKYDTVPFHASLRPGDTESTTVGCRHSNPDICSKNGLMTVCAFMRKDGMCLAPSKDWPRQFRHLGRSATKGEE